MKHCVPSFLAAMADRSDFHLRWLCHVDDYPGLEKYWPEECRAAEAIAPQFNEFRAAFTCGHRGYGGAVSRMLELMENDVLWVEDDWDWTGKSFRMADVLAATKDCFSFWGPTTKAGALHPTFYRKHVFDFLRGRMPENLATFSECLSFHILRRHFEMTGIQLLSLEENHIGHKRMQELGFTHNAFGQRVGKRLHRPIWDAETESFVKQ